MFRAAASESYKRQTDGAHNKPCGLTRGKSFAEKREAHNKQYRRKGNVSGYGADVHLPARAKSKYVPKLQPDYA